MNGNTKLTDEAIARLDGEFSLRTVVKEIKRAHPSLHIGGLKSQKPRILDDSCTAATELPHLTLR